MLFLCCYSRQPVNFISALVNEEFEHGYESTPEWLSHPVVLVPFYYYIKDIKNLCFHEFLIQGEQAH